jgi:acyl-CoA thioesterase
VAVEPPAGPDPAPNRLIDEVVTADLALLDTFGLVVAEAGVEGCVIAATARPELVNSTGVVHGGLAFMLADTASAYALAARDVHGVTVGSNLVFTRPARSGEEIRAEAIVETVGRRMATVSVRVTSWDRLLAHGTFQFAVVEDRRPPSSGESPAPR